MNTPSSKLPLIPELLRLICEELHSHKGTLVSLAVTCSAFKNPALDTLWFRLDGFYNLAKCLHPGVWKEVQGEHRKTTLTIQEPIHPTDFLAMLQYAKRVKEFHWEHWLSRKIVDVSVYQAIQVILAGDILMPNIRGLHCGYMTETDPRFPFINMFLGPHLSRFTWCFPGKSSSQLSIIPILEDNYPNLTDISLDFAFHFDNDPQFEHDITLSLSNSVNKWQKLESLSITNINHTGLTNLSKLPQLQRLNISSWKTDASFDSTARKPIQGFFALTHLRIVTETSSCARFLETVECWRLNTLEISIKNRALTEWRKLINTIRDRCHLEALEVIDCSDDFRQGDSISYNEMQPLLDFKNLQKLRIVSAEVFISDSSTTMQMARSWTKIKLLKLEESTSQVSTITLLDLLPFAEHCPDLEELNISLNAMSPPTIDMYRPGNGPGIRQHKLVMLNVKDSPACNHDLIAAFLSSTFPSLRYILHAESCPVATDDSELEDDGLQTEAWGKAEELLGVIAAAREQAGIIAT